MVIARSVSSVTPLAESGQALVELAILLPVVAVLLGVTFNGWDAMQQSIRLTTAARAAAIAAAHDMSAGKASSAATDAVAAVNSEESSSAYQSGNPAADDYVATSTGTETTSAGVTISVVRVTISHASVTLVPVVWALHVNTTATARY